MGWVRICVAFVGLVACLVTVACGGGSGGSSTRTALYVVGVTAFAAVRAVEIGAGDTVVVSAAAGGVGAITVQLLKVPGRERRRARLLRPPRLAAREGRDAGRLRRGRGGADHRGDARRDRRLRRPLRARVRRTGGRARRAAGKIEVPIAATYPLEEVREAFEQLEARHTLGKIVLIP